MQEQELSGDPRPSWDVSVMMLRAVLDGAAYDAVAALHGVSRTAVERRIKAERPTWPAAPESTG